MKCNVMESEICKVMLALIFNAKLIIYHYHMDIEWDKNIYRFCMACKIL